MVILVYFLIILASVTQSASTKIFNRRSSHSVVFNAIKAGSALCLFALSAAFGFSFHLPTLFFGLAYGGSLCLSMYAGYRALCLGPMALSSMLVSFSVAIPLVWGITVGDESLRLIQCVALVFLVLAIVLTNADKFRSGARSESVDYGLWLAFVGITFACNGIGSILQKQHQTLYPEAYSREFMLFAMLLCTVIFFAVALKRLSFAQMRETKGKRYGVISGITTAVSSFLTLSLAGFENASVLFPIISAGTVLSALLCGRLLFGEKLKLNHYLALVFGIVAVVLLKL